MSVLIAASLLLLLARAIGRYDARRRNGAGAPDSPYTELEAVDATAAARVDRPLRQPRPVVRAAEAPSVRRGLRAAISGSIAMSAIRRVTRRSSNVPIETEVGFVDQDVLEHRIGVIGATAAPGSAPLTSTAAPTPAGSPVPTRPARLVVAGTTSLVQTVRDAEQRETTDRRRLWRDTAAALVGLAAVLFIAINLIPSKPQGAVLAETATPAPTSEIVTLPLDSAVPSLGI